MSAGTVRTSVPGGNNLDALVTEFQSEAFVKSSALEKRERLWEAVSARPYPELPPANVSRIGSLFRILKLALMRKAFEVDADVRPPRLKSFHPYGTVGKVRFVADGRHDYTGLLSSGAVGLARLSVALSAKDFAPSTAFKFFIDGKPSRNLLLDQSIDKQSSRDFFERSQNNVTLWPRLFPMSLIWYFVDAVLSRIAPVLEQPLDHIASITSEGREVSRFNAPYRVYCVASGEVHHPPDTTEDFRNLLGRIPPGTILYRVYANRTATDPEMTYIGYIETESHFVASEFGDRVLSLRHFRRKTPGNS